jgi:LCP family protein required for cell wall assembly
MPPVFRADTGGDGGDIHPLPNLPKTTTRRRRRRRPLYRRPLFVVPVALLVLMVSAAAVVGYRVESLMTTVHAVSTPPPIVTDQTYMEEDDPDMPAQPISVDTGPAREALEASDGSDQGDEGFAARLQQAASNSSDLIGGAAVAAGIKNQGADPITLLVMGVDARPGAAIDIGVRPDVLMLVRLDPDTHSCRVLAVPRDTRVELPGYGESKINHALMVGGIPYQMMVTESFLDVEIDHYVLIDFVAFEQLVDSVGGVTVNVPEELVKNGEVTFPEGSQHFDGADALAYTRYRGPATEGDIGRVERRWALLSGLADAIQGRDLVSDANRMVPALKDHMRTDLSATDVTQMAKDYGTGCTSPQVRSSEYIDVMEGTRIRLNDPILNQSLYFNVVEDAQVAKYVDAFMNPEEGEAPATPAGTPVATPEATPAASPSPVASNRERGAYVRGMASGES